MGTNTKKGVKAPIKTSKISRKARVGNVEAAYKRGTDEQKQLITLAAKTGKAYGGKERALKDAEKVAATVTISPNKRKKKIKK